MTVVIQDAEVQALINDLISKTARPRAALDAVGTRIVARIRATFVAGASPYGEKWAPLKFRRGRPLFKTGRTLFNRITHSTSETSVDVGIFNKRSAEIGEKHQFGAVEKAPPGKFIIFKDEIHDKLVFARKIRIPARPFLPIRGSVADLPRTWIDDITALFEKDFEK